MKIITRAKDYYDYIAHQYGVDNSIVYDRISAKIGQMKLSEFFDKKYKNDGVYYHWYTRNTKYEFAWLFVCGHQYLLWKHDDCANLKKDEVRVREFKVVEEYELNDKQMSHGFPAFSVRGWYSTAAQREKVKKTFKDYYMGRYEEKNIDLHRKYRQPVILFNSTSDGLVPTLSDIHGFAKLYPAEKLYQDICYFFTAQVDGNPDVDKQVKIEDKYLITAKGFDIKTSFRNAKNVSTNNYKR